MDELEMRRFIRLVEDHQYEPIIEFHEPVVDQDEASIKDDLVDLVSKLNNHYEADDSEEALGIELGMRRAADMIENLLRKYTEKDVG